MGSNWLSIDNNMPTITGTETTWQLIMKLHNFIPIMVESLKYQLSNLESSNWNPKAMSSFQKETTKEVEEAVDNTDKELLALVADLEKMEQRVEDIARRITETETDMAAVLVWKEEVEKTLDMLERGIEQVQADMDAMDQVIRVGEDGSLTIGADGIAVNIVGNVKINGVAQ